MDGNITDLYKLPDISKYENIHLLTLSEACSVLEEQVYEIANSLPDAKRQIIEAYTLAAEMIWKWKHLKPHCVGEKNTIDDPHKQPATGFPVAGLFYRFPAVRCLSSARFLWNRRSLHSSAVCRSSSRHWVSLIFAGLPVSISKAISQ